MFQKIKKEVICDESPLFFFILLNVYIFISLFARTRTRLGQKSLSYAGIKIWNEISSSLKEVSFYRFKKAVKAHFLSTYKIDKS